MTAGTALWGWGRVIRRWLPGPRVSGPLTTVLGLGGILFAGGVLNAAGWAHPAALNALIAAGIAVALGAAAERLIGGRALRRPAAGAGLAAIPLLVAGGFLAVHLVPQQTYNLYDDFQKYFAYPVRMLATGSLRGTRLSALGGQTLGGQAWLQGFALAHLSPAYLGTVDTFLGLLLCLALAGFGFRPGRRAAAALAAEGAVLAINPEIINTSAVFSGSALILGLILLAGAGDEAEAAEPPAAWLGLLYAGMITLKTTFVLFVVLHLLALAVARGWLGTSRRAGLRPGLRSAAWTGVFLCPWLLLHAPRYGQALGAAAINPPVVVPEPFGLFSTAPELYGGTQLHYTALAGAALAVAGLGLLAGRRGWIRPTAAAASAVAGLAAAGLGYFILVGWLAPAAFGREGATRYAGPFLIGAVPAAIVFLGRIEFRPGRRGGRIVPAVLLGLVLAAFLPSLAVRVREIAAYGTPLAFTPSVASPAFIDYNRSALSDAARARLEAVQRLVPPGERVVAWVSTPFWLDFRRNDVVETNPSGLAARWAWPVPARYYLWEYRGYSVKYPGFVTRTPDDYNRIFLGECLMDRIESVRALAFVQYLEHRAQGAELLYNDGSLALFRTAR